MSSVPSGASPRCVESLLEHAAFARRLARALVVDDARADDVVQQTFLSALQRPPRESHRLRHWIATVVRNTASKLRREESRRERREQLVARVEATPSSSDVAAQLAAQRELLDAVARLDEPSRSTVHARYFEEATPTEIANTQGIPVRTVETRLRRAIERLRRDLDARFAGGRGAWAALLLGGPTMAVKAKSVGLTVAATLAVAATATIVIATVHHERAREGGALDPAPIAVVEPAAATSAPAVAEATSGAVGSPLVASRASTLCRVSVVTPQREPVAGASMILFRSEDVVADATSDASGEATLPIQREASRLLVDPRIAPTCVVDVAAGSESVEFALEGGAEFSGRVVVEGGTPTAPIELCIGVGSADPSTRFLPDAVWKRARELRERGTGRFLPTSLRVTTNDDGAFRLLGLPPDRAFTVSLPVPYEDATTGRADVRVDSARTNFELSLRVNPSIRGRLVDVAGRPLAGWHVEGWTGSDAGAASEEPAASREDGSFTIYLHNKHSFATTYAVLHVTDPEQVFARGVHFDRRVDQGCDVGEIVVDVRRLLAIDARDDGGKAIDGLLVVERRVALEERMAFRDRRDVVAAAHARRGTVLPPDLESVHVLAAGFATKDVEPKPSDVTLKLTLERAAQLVLDVKENDGRRATGCTLEVTGSTWPAAWSREDLVAAHSIAGGTALTSEESNSKSTTTFQLASCSETSPFQLVALKPSTPITLVLHDRLGVELLRETLTLESGERRELARTLESNARTLVGLVHGPDGQPIPSARVEWSADGDRHVQLAWTAKDGRFKLEAVRAKRLSLLVEGGPGFCCRRVDDVDPATTTQPLDVELKPGSSTLCMFFGANGLVEPTDVWIERADARTVLDGADEQPAHDAVVAADASPRRLFVDLPDGKLWLRARVDGFTYALDVSRGAQTSFNVTVVGPVEVDWTISAAAAAGRTLQAIRLVPRMRPVRATSTIDAASAARGSGRASFGSVPPDHYTVVLVWSDPNGATTEERSGVEFDVSSGVPTSFTLTQ